MALHNAVPLQLHLLQHRDAEEPEAIGDDGAAGVDQREPRGLDAVARPDHPVLGIKQVEGAGDAEKAGGDKRGLIQLTGVTNRLREAGDGKEERAGLGLGEERGVHVGRGPAEP